MKTLKEVSPIIGAILSVIALVAGIRPFCLMIIFIKDGLLK